MWKVMCKKHLYIAIQLALLIAGISSWVGNAFLSTDNQASNNQSGLSSSDWFNFFFIFLQRNVSTVLLSPTFQTPWKNGKKVPVTVVWRAVYYLPLVSQDLYSNDRVIARALSLCLDSIVFVFHLRVYGQGLKFCGMDSKGKLLLSQVIYWLHFS